MLCEDTFLRVEWCTELHMYVGSHAVSAGVRVQLCRRLCSSEPVFHTGQSLNAEPRALGLSGAPYPGGDGGWLAQGLLPHTHPIQREAGDGRPD